MAGCTPDAGFSASVVDHCHLFVELEASDCFGQSVVGVRAAMTQPIHCNHESHTLQGFDPVLPKHDAL